MGVGVGACTKQSWQSEFTNVKAILWKGREEEVEDRGGRGVRGERDGEGRRGVGKRKRETPAACLDSPQSHTEQYSGHVLINSKFLPLILTSALSLINLLKSRPSLIIANTMNPVMTA